MFYTSLFAFKVEFDSDWFIHLVSESKGLELGIISEQHEIVPDKVKGRISGIYLTFVIENVDESFRQCLALNYEIILEPDMTPYGQKRMLVSAPEGTICDISSPS